MECATCGTPFVGRFCPQCGSPAVAQVGPAPIACPRCGTQYSGNYCPSCGSPAYPYVPLAPPQTVRSVLSYVWLIAVLLFAILLASNFATLAVVTPTVFEGIQNLRTGSSGNPGFDADLDGWSRQSNPANVSETNWTATGGNPGAFAETKFVASPSSMAEALWTRSFETAGSTPFIAYLRLDFRVLSNSAQSVELSAYVERGPGWPVSPPVYSLSDASPAFAWTSAAAPDPFTGALSTRLWLPSALREPGTLYLKVRIAVEFVSAPTTDTVVGLDNVQARWGTNAGLQLFLLVPPVVVGQTRDPTLFAVYFGLILAAIVGALAVQVAVDARPLVRLVRSHPEDLRGRLRARVGFTALAQVFLASFAFQLWYLLILRALSVPTASPLDSQELPAWFVLFQLANASVFEEVISRILLIGVPLFGASLILRVGHVLRHRVSPARGRYVLGSLRFLYGGNVTRDSPMPTLVAAGILLALSSAIFGLAHEPGYGAWKILPSAVGGLALGYLYLRHGLAAAILGHFAQDYFLAIVFTPSFPSAWGILLDILLLAALYLGLGFLAYYVWDIATLGRHIAARLRGPSIVSAAPVPGWPHAPPAAGADRPMAPAARPAGQASSELLAIPPGYTPFGRPPRFGVAPVQFRCTRCGWVEARYDEGRFTCLRCGFTA